MMSFDDIKIEMAKIADCHPSVEPFYIGIFHAFLTTSFNQIEQVLYCSANFMQVKEGDIKIILQHLNLVRDLILQDIVKPYFKAAEGIEK